MAIRVTQQYVDVLGTGTGNMRVSRQYIEVLHAGVTTGNINGNASSTLSLTDTVHGLIPDQAAVTTLSVSDAAQSARVVSASVSTTLVLADSITKSTTVSASNVIILLDVETHFNYLNDRSPADTVLTLTQLVTTSDSRSGESLLGLTHSVDVRGPFPVWANNDLFLAQEARSLDVYVSASNDLSISNVVGSPYPVTVTHTLTLFDTSSMTFVVDFLTLTDLAEAGRSPGVQIQVLVLSQTLKANGTFRRTVPETLGVGHSLTYFEDTPCNRKEYAPFMGDNTVPNAKEAPAASIPNPQADTSASDPCDPQRFLLYYPARGARSTEIGIRAPEFGNRDRNAYTRINRETKGGKLVVYSDTSWPKIRTMLVTFIALPKDAIDSIQTLFKDRLGQLIGLTDWEGHEWEGVITDPEEPVTQDGKRGWTLTFSFEGQIIDGHSPGNAITVADTLDTGKDPGANSALTMSDEVGGADAVGGQGQNMDIMQTASAVVA